MTDQDRPPASPQPEPPPGLPAQAPLVAWEAPAPAFAPPPGQAGVGAYDGGPPAFTIGALLSDAFARYGADPIRFFVLALVATVLSFLGTFLSIPFGGSTFGLATDSGGLVGLLSFVVGLVTGSATFALAEGGADMPFGRVLRRGVERSGWMFLTSLLLGIGFIVAFLIAAIPVVVLAFLSPTAALLVLIPLVLVFIWLALRVALALPANVVDNRNSIEAIQLSWRVTARSAVWARLLGSSLLIGLLVLPATLGGGLLLLLATFGGKPPLLLFVSTLFAFFTPLSGLILYSAYRRLVPPLQASWAAPTGAAVSIDAPPQVPAEAAAPPNPAVLPDASLPHDAVAAPHVVASAPADASVPAPASFAPTVAPSMPVPVPAPPAFRVPPFDLAAKALLALVVALDVAGLAAVPYVAGEIAGGRVTFPRFPTSPGGQFPGLSGEGFVLPGTIAFGTSADVASCSVLGQGIVHRASSPIVWVAAFDRRLGAADQVVLRVDRDGEVVRDELWGPVAGACLGVEQPEPGLVPGIYTYQVSVNGRVEAAGTLIVQ